MGNSGTRVRRQLPSHPSSAGEARRMVGRLLTDAGRDDLVEHAQLLVSEVVTNALVHSATPIDVSVAATEDGVLVEVGDGNQHIPRPRHYAVTASTGRGLALLDQTADAWGVVPGIRGKTVWFQLSSADTEDAPDPADWRDDASTHAIVVPLRRGDRAATVRLLNVPLLLHAAWQQHAEGVLREYLLASMDMESDEEALVVHAGATDALAVLAEHIPQPDVGSEPEELMTNAVDPRVTSPQVDLVVPHSCVAHFDLLGRTMDVATTMAEEGELLLPTVQPEMRQLRRWLCDEVKNQVAGAEPVPWPLPEELVPPPRRALDWDPAPVRDAGVPMLAADDTDLILAVSGPAAELLGYDDRDQLVGQRLVTIIPHRYRQAHIAGFAMHLLNGRSPLLERPVRVPALRRDGSETIVELSVEPHRMALGRTLFVASLREAASPSGG